MGKLKVLFFMALIALVSCAIGCKSDDSTFSGSKTGNDNQFLVDFDALNSTLSHTMPLLEGDRIETTINIEKGDVDILVQSASGRVIYQGNDVETCSFVLEVQEADTYTFSITGSKAEGSVHFVKALTDDAD